MDEDKTSPPAYSLERDDNLDPPPYSPAPFPDQTFPPSPYTQQPDLSEPTPPYIQPPPDDSLHFQSPENTNQTSPAYDAASYSVPPPLRTFPVEQIPPRSHRNHTVVNEPSHRTHSRSRDSFKFPELLACFVACCCVSVCGCIAYFVAAKGRTYYASDGNETRARRARRFSYGCSIVGMLSTVLLVVYFIPLFTTKPCFNPPNHCNNDYYIDNQGCKRCCVEIGHCSNGHYTDSHGCTLCCDAVTFCASGRYTDSHGCRACCDTVNYCDIGHVYDNYGCRRCCKSIYRISYDYYGCKICCSSKQEYSSKD